jgi:hypothetical protein
MHATDNNGHTVIFMPRDRDKAVTQLAGIGVVLASREWERAALVSLLVESKGRGRPKNGVKFEKYSISDFARLGIFGFRSANTISAYLKIWALAGLPAPQPGDKVALPIQDWPDMSEIYGREPKIDDGDVDKEFDEDEDEEEEESQPRPSIGKHAKPAAKAKADDVPKPPPPPGRDPIDALLSAFNRISPEDATTGATKEQIKLLYKSLESWLEDLRELIEKET